MLVVIGENGVSVYGGSGATELRGVTSAVCGGCKCGYGCLHSLCGSAWLLSSARVTG